MNVSIPIRISGVLTVVVMLFLVSCTPGVYLKSEPAGDSVPGGPVTLFLYGADTPLRMAIMDIEGDAYTFTMTGSTHEYRVRRNIPAAQAHQEARVFMAGQRYRWGNIFDSRGNAIGHDMRPVYHLLRYGRSDILDAAYLLRDGEVSVSVELKNTFKKIFDRDIYGGE